MSNYLKIILTGIKVWVDDKLEDISYITASHLNSLNDRVENVENIFGDTIVESGYSERALYTDHEIDGDIMATGKTFKCGSKISLFIKNADTLSGQQDVYYVLPYAPDNSYLSIVDNHGLYESNGVQFKVVFTTQTINNIIYDVIKLNRYDNGSIVNWESNQSVSFNIDYISETI